MDPRNIFFLIFIILFFYLFLKKIIEIFIKLKESYKSIHKFNVILVKTINSRKNGLMFRKQKLKPNEGMLFDFKKPRKVSLWMKNTFIPLDAIFINENGKIVDLISDMKPKSLKSNTSNKLCKYVLEVNANSIKEKNIKKGDYINIKKIKKLS